jgi:hypothetical protein
MYVNNNTCKGHSHENREGISKAMRGCFLPKQRTANTNTFKHYLIATIKSSLFVSWKSNQV